MQDKCPKCGEPLITKTIKKELGHGSIDYPIALVCPKCHWSKDLTGAGDIVSQPVAPGKIKTEEKPPATAPAPPKAPAKPELPINKIITIALAILVLGGIVWAFILYPAPKQVEVPRPTPTATVTQTSVQPTSTPVSEVTPTGNKTRIKLDSRRGFIPDTKTIKPGDEIIWENSEAETVTLVSKDGLYISNDGLFDNQTLAYGKRTNYTFLKPGTYSFNLKDKNLTGTVIVEP
jgi:plastocyanin